MPRPECLKVMKNKRKNPEKAMKPYLIKKDKYDLWFKQDDTFEQPFISIQCKI